MAFSNQQIQVQYKLESNFITVTSEKNRLFCECKRKNTKKKMEKTFFLKKKRY